MTKTIELRTAVPGPRSAEILARKEQVVAEPLSIYAPLVIAEGSGATLTDVDGNTFIDFTGGVGCLAVGHAQPARRRGGAGADAALRAHRLHGRAVRGLRRARRAALRADADLRTDEGRVLQLRRRGGRERREDRARPHEAAGRDRVRGRLSRAHAARDHAHVEDAPVQGRPRAVRAGGLPRRRSRTTIAARTQPPRWPRSSAPSSRRSPPSRWPRSSSSRSRARAASSSAPGVPGRPPRALRRARHRADRRRGADRLRPHRPDVRDRALTTSSPTSSSSRSRSPAACRSPA